MRGGLSEERGWDMLDDLLERRPYNAATDLVDAPVARGLGDKLAFIDSDRALTYRGLQARSCRFASALADLGLRPEERLAPALRHGRFSGGILGRRARRYRGAAAQHAADTRAIRLHPRRQPRGRHCRFRFVCQGASACSRPPAPPAHNDCPRWQRRGPRRLFWTLCQGPRRT